MSKRTLCYNKGCGSEFDPDTNNADACRYHPGDPVFHDLKKKWSCCNKQSSDFTEFLNIRGCTTGPHSGDKPKNSMKPASNDVPLTEKPIHTPEIHHYKITPDELRPSEDESMIPLKCVIAASLQKILKSGLQNGPNDQNSSESDFKDLGRCKNTGCNAANTGADSDVAVCLYHPGAAIFHEGMKYWSCCCRKTSDFDDFMRQAGCTTGKHAWTQDEAASKNLMARPVLMQCRHDWFQLPDSVNICVYARHSLPESVHIRCNRVCLSIAFTYEGGKSYYEKTIRLFSTVVPEESVVTLTAPKVEIVLKKNAARSWSSLEYRPAIQTS